MNPSKEKLLILYSVFSNDFKCAITLLLNLLLNFYFNKIQCFFKLHQDNEVLDIASLQQAGVQRQGC